MYLNQAFGVQCLFKGRNLGHRTVVLSSATVFAHEMKAVLSCTFMWCCVLCRRYKVFLTFESADETLKCDHSNETHFY